MRRRAITTPLCGTILAAIKLVEKDHPEYEWPYTNLADLLLKTGDPQRAFDAASKAANRNPDVGAQFLCRGESAEPARKNRNWR